VGILKAHLLKP
jgi:hypothetical protein